MDEARLLDLTIAMGIPWKTPLGVLARRSGVRRWFDFVDVVDIPLSAPTPSIGGAYYVHHRPTEEPWPPTHYLADAFTEGDVLRQHEVLTTELERVIGPGMPRTTMNAVVTAWRAGALSLEILSFRRDKSPTNSLYERHPELWRSTRVTLSAEYFAFEPDPRLTSALALPAIAVVDGPRASWFGPFVRRNPAAFASAQATTVRFDRDTDEIVVSASDRSLVVCRAWCTRLSLTRLAPARGSGRSELWVGCRHPEDGGFERRLPIFRGAAPKSLDEAAAAMSRALDLPLDISDDDDD